MKLVNFSSRFNSKVRPGVLLKDKIVDIGSSLSASGMMSIIQGGSDHLRKIKEFVADDSSISFQKSLVPMADAKLLAPIVPQRNVLCVGKNYIDHIQEIASVRKNDATKPQTAPSKYPVFFTKAPQCVIGPNDSVLNHSNLTKWLDYEAELAVIIGPCSGRDIPVSQAMDYVFGYTAANDITARDLQSKHNQWFKGKTLDTTCPLGPCIVPQEEIERFNQEQLKKDPSFLDPLPSHDPSAPPPTEEELALLARLPNLSIQLTLNGTLMQSSRTNRMIFNIPHIIHHLSQGFTLYPGDVILTGTPEGVGYARSPPVCLKRGDQMKVFIEEIGELENIVD